METPTIVFAFNKGFLNPAKVALFSLFQFGNIPAGTNVVVFVDDSVDFGEFDWLEDRVTVRRLDFDYVPQDPVMSFQTKEHVYGTALSVAAIDTLHGEGHERVVWLDADVFIQDRIDKLVELDLDGQVIGAALDYHFDEMTVLRYDSAGEYKRSEPFHRLYFNAGVMVFDLQKYYAEAGWTTGDFRKVLEERRDSLKFMEQDILNEYSNGKIHVLPQKYNWIPDWFIELRDDRDAKNEYLANTPVNIVHLLGHIKPWEPLPKTPMRKQFRIGNYLELCREIEEELDPWFIEGLEKNL